MVQPNLEDLLNQTQTKTFSELDLNLYLSSLVAFTAQQYEIDLQTPEGQSKGQEIANQYGEILTPFYMTSIDDLKEFGLERKPGFDDFSKYVGVNKTFYTALESIIDDKTISINDYQAKRQEVIGNLFKLEDYMAHIESGISGIYELGKDNLLSLPSSNKDEISQNIEGFQSVLSLYANIMISEAAQIYGIENVNNYLSQKNSTLSIDSDQKAA